MTFCELKYSFSKEYSNSKKMLSHFCCKTLHGWHWIKWVNTGSEESSLWMWWSLELLILFSFCQTWVHRKNKCLKCFFYYLSQNMCFFLNISILSVYEAASACPLTMRLCWNFSENNATIETPLYMYLGKYGRDLFFLHLENLKWSAILIC